MHPLILTEETEVSFLAANDPVFSSLVSDDYKAYIHFRISTAFPTSLALNNTGAISALHRACSSLRINRCCTNRRTSATRSRHTVPTATASSAGSSAWQWATCPRPPCTIRSVPIPETMDQAPYLDCVASIYNSPKA